MIRSRACPSLVPRLVGGTGGGWGQRRRLRGAALCTGDWSHGEVRRMCVCVFVCVCEGGERPVLNGGKVKVREEQG